MIFHSRSQMLAMLVLSSGRHSPNKFLLKFWINWFVLLETFILCCKHFKPKLKNDQPPFLQVEQIPLPILFMRTVLQAIGAFPALVRISEASCVFNLLIKRVGWYILYSVYNYVICLSCDKLTTKTPSSF